MPIASTIASTLILRKGPEDIKLFELGVNELFYRLVHGAIEDPKLIIAAYWLRERLERHEASARDTASVGLKEPADRAAIAPVAGSLRRKLLIVFSLLLGGGLAALLIAFGQYDLKEIVQRTGAFLRRW
jgi:hypothetical protein